MVLYFPATKREFSVLQQREELECWVGSNASDAHLQWRDKDLTTAANNPTIVHVYFTAAGYKSLDDAKEQAIPPSP